MPFPQGHCPVSSHIPSQHIECCVQWPDVLGTVATGRLLAVVLCRVGGGVATAEAEPSQAGQSGRSEEATAGLSGGEPSDECVEATFIHRMLLSTRAGRFRPARAT